jgi:hypothetical protein
MSDFLNRWSKRKAGLESDESVTKEKSKLEKSTLAKGSQSSSVTSAKDSTAKSNEAATADGTLKDADQPVTPEQATIPTLEDVLKLTKDSDFSAYVQSGIDPNVQQAALNKLFSDPHFNIMDGLDIYIGDYNTPDPMPLEMLKQLNQSKMLGMFKTPEEIEADLQAELIERKEYKERLAKIDADEAEVEATAALKAEEDTKAEEEAKEAKEAKAKEAKENKDLSEQSAALEDSSGVPDENANGINAANSAKSNNLQETIKITKSESVLNKT